MLSKFAKPGEEKDPNNNNNGSKTKAQVGFKTDSDEFRRDDKRITFQKQGSRGSYLYTGKPEDDTNTKKISYTNKEREKIAKAKISSGELYLDPFKEWGYNAIDYSQVS
jgi:hypothetical protein